LRKLLRNLEEFYHNVLGKDAEFDVCTAKLASIARSSDKEALAELFELVAAAAVTCDNRSEFVSHIMSMAPENQAQMKGIIESSLSRLSDYDAATGQEDDEVEENEMVFDQDAAGAMPIEEDDSLFAPGSRTRTSYSAGKDEGREELEKALMDARRELAAHKSQASLMSEDSDSAHKKLKALVGDLQDRLEKRQNELADIEGQYKMASVELQDAKSRLDDLEEKNMQLADDLDVANSKAEQLRKAEATVVSYRKKLEGVGAMNQQMSDLEDQAASYLKQIVELENEAKKIPTMQKTIDEFRDQLTAMERDSADAGSVVKGSVSEIAQLKSKLSAAESAKKMYEEELEELRAQQGVSADDELGSPMAGLSLSNQDSAATKEKLMRLEIENKSLQSEVDKLKVGDGAATTAAAAAATAAAVANDGALKDEISRLETEVAKKEAEKFKIGSDKEKLEAYTKRTLAKFQEKYLVALQECKAKLKEKQDKIEALENRSASEKTAQKREERLLSSTIYELGLTIMQNRLKER
jgi:protein HOOK3